MEPLKRQFRLVASSPHAGDLINLLKLMALQAADVRIPLNLKGVEDTLDTRKAVASYLQDAIDRLRRVGNDELQRSTDAEDADVDH